MDTSILSNNFDSQRISTETKPHNELKISMVALGLVLSNNQMPINSINVTSNIIMRSCIDGSFSTNGVYSNIARYNYAERYRIIAQSAWFEKAYKNKSLGEIIGIEV
jgi:hypothetical protein